MFIEQDLASLSLYVEHETRISGAHLPSPLVANLVVKGNIYSIRGWGWDVLCVKTKEHSPRHGVIFIPAFYWVLLNTKPDHTARASNAGDATTYNLISTCCSAAGVVPPLPTLNISRCPQERLQPRNDYERKKCILVPISLEVLDAVRQ